MKLKSYKHLITLLFVMLFLTLTGSKFYTHVSSSSPKILDKAYIKECRFKGIKLYGKVKIVNDFPDIKVQIVENFPDLKVKIVENFPNDCGKWELVDNFPDFKVQFVENFPDIKVKFVENFPGE